MSGVFLAIIVCVIAIALFSAGYVAWRHNSGAGTNGRADPDIHGKPHDPDIPDRPHSHSDPGRNTNHEDPDDPNRKCNVIRTGNGVGESKPCCQGLEYSYVNGPCAKAFDCSKEAVQKDNCIRHRSGEQCNADESCIVLAIPSPDDMGDPIAFVCVDKAYEDGIGIAPDKQSATKCVNFLMDNYAFPGGLDGCTTLGDRPVPNTNSPIDGCCTLHVDSGCKHDDGT